MIASYYFSAKYTIDGDHDANHVADEQDDCAVEARDVPFADAFCEKYAVMIQVLDAHLADVTVVHRPLFLVNIKLNVAFLAMVVSLIRIRLTPVHFSVIVFLLLEFLKFAD